MTDQPQLLDVGRSSIDAYLDSVEQALIQSNALRADRMQVVQDLESQIDDMLAQQDQPLTLASVESVIEQLEPPSHFAATYGTASEVTESSSVIRQTVNPWLLASAVSGLIAGGLMLTMVAIMATFRVTSGTEVLLTTFLVIQGIALVFMPIAIRIGVRQLRAEPQRYSGRKLAIMVSMGYVVVVPILALAYLCLVTSGDALYFIGPILLVYIQYKLACRLRAHLSESLPPDPDGPIETLPKQNHYGSDQFTHQASPVTPV